MKGFLKMIDYDRIKQTEDGEDVYLGWDGNMRFAVREDFVDLAEYTAGFGETDEIAIADLLRQER
jgi:hypothetical protein